MHASRGPGLRVKVAMAVVAVTVGAGLCEVAARTLYPRPPEAAREPQILYERHPGVGFLHVPNQGGWLDDGFATINAMGLRGRLPAMPKPDGSIRVLAVGDSTTFGWGVADDDTYSSQLEQKLQEALPGRRVDVVNGGVGAYDLKQATRLLRHFDPSLDPDIVLVGVFWNDLPYEAMSPDGVPHLTRPAAPSSRTSEDAPSRPFRIGNQPSRMNRILRSSRLLFVLRHAWLAAIAPTEAATNLVQWEMALLEGRRTAAIDEAWRDIEGTLCDIRSLSETSGFAVGIVIVPIRAQVEHDYPQAEYQTRVRAMGEGLGFFAIDPLPRFRADADPRSLFIPYDRMHFSARGNAILAEAVFDALRRRPEFQ